MYKPRDKIQPHLDLGLLSCTFIDNLFVVGVSRSVLLHVPFEDFLQVSEERMRGAVTHHNSFLR
jgi:hypothetical protein